MSKDSVGGSTVVASNGEAVWEMGLDEFDRLSGCLGDLENVAVVLFKALDGEGVGVELGGTAYHLGEMARDLLAWCREQAGSVKAVESMEAERRDDGSASC